MQREPLPRVGFTAATRASLVLTLALTACLSTASEAPAGARAEASAPAASPLPASAPARPAPTPAAAVPADQPLDLAGALAATLARHPGLRAADGWIRASLADERAADHGPAPSVGLDLEDFAGSGEVEGLEGAQTTLWLGLPLERGDKREARGALARAGTELATLERALVAADLRDLVSRAFWTALHAQAALELALADEATAQEVLDAIDQRIEAGRGTPLERQRYAMALTEARLERRTTELALTARRRELAALWGAEAAFGPLLGDLAAAELPAPAALDQALAAGPRLALAQARVRRAEAEEQRTASEADPDWTLTLGLRRYEATDDGGLVLGLEVPLPSRGMQSDLLEAARARRDGQAHRREATARELTAELTRAELAFRRADHAAGDLQAQLIPEARAVFEAHEAAYREGRADLIDLLDAQGALLDARRRLLDAQLDRRLARVEVERLLAAPLPRTTDPDTRP